jgi:hypothetical protein
MKSGNVSSSPALSLSDIDIVLLEKMAQESGKNNSLGDSFTAKRRRAKCCSPIRTRKEHPMAGIEDLQDLSR